jgi:transposase
LKAYLAFLDESGLLMAPLVRRSWSPRGQTPILYQRTRSYQKVSMLATLCVAPARNRVSLYFRLHPNENIRAPLVADFLRQLRTQLAAPVILIWDRLPSHRARCVQNWLQQQTGLDAEFLPPYAPELNPVEYLWSYLKTNPLANLAVTELDPLTRPARRHTRRIQYNQQLLRSFLAHSPLFLRLK